MSRPPAATQLLMPERNLIHEVFAVAYLKPPQLSLRRGEA
jgi:hypothetical protein